jgi:ribosomal protein S12 methylthiotransferase
VKLYLETLGCARNQVDSEGMLELLLQSGWEATDDPATADAIVVNTCSFIEKAIDESIDTILELARHKRSGRCRRLVVTGCLPERFREQLADTLPEVDVFLGTGAFDLIPSAVGAAGDARNCRFPDPDAVDGAAGVGRRRLTPPASAYLKIAEGCSRHCTYCIIPRLRGRQKSRPATAIVREARQLIATGTRELVLVAQDTTAYGSDRGRPGDLHRLLRELAILSPDIWIRFLYGHPASIDDAVLAAVADHANICSYFDIPIQHASDPVLKAMGRGYTRADLHRVFDKIRHRVPAAVLRTTVITGFPGETREDFDTLEAFVREIAFDHLGVFVYSDFDDLPSHRLAGHVPAALAQKRSDMLMARQQEISERNQRRYRGRRIPVLVETRSEEGLYVGRASFQAPEVDGVTYVHGTDLPIGEFAAVTITDTMEYDLVGALR